MLMETVIKDLKTLVNSVEIKYSKKSKQYETVDSLRSADEYINAVMGMDVFDGYSSFDMEILMDAGIIEPKYTFAEILSFVDDKYNIPRFEREAVMNAKRNKIIKEFDEKNNYYRELNGKPNIDDNNLFKLTIDEASKYGINLTQLNGLYLHEYPDEVLYVLQNSGYIDELLKNNPDKKYLKYLGYSKVDIVAARNASNFSIIKISKDVPDNFYNQFVSVYDQNREYFMTTIYNQDYSAQYDMYDNFIGLCIMIMTIQRMVSLAFKSGIQRDFYDWQFIQNMYKMYNIPFVEDIPIEYHVTLMKNLNNLLRYKSTDKVLFDVCSLLGYERIKIFQYYLVKEHKLDENENPIFIYKQDNEGNYIEDKEKMYELYFQSVNINERNIALALSDTSNRLDYDEVISNDPYWWEDEDLRKAKYYNEYNYIETKYISLNMMYKMTEMLFELTYAFNMMQDNKDSISDIYIDLPKVAESERFHLFDTIIFMIALVCKMHGFDGNIPAEASLISHIYGFDFDDEQLSKIRDIIRDNADKLEIDLVTNEPVLLKYFIDLDATTADAVNKLFINIRDYNDYIVNKMYSSKDIDEYNIYKQIFNISMTKKSQNAIFEIDVLGDSGNIDRRAAKTYIEYLRYTNPLLADTVETIDKSAISDMIEHTVSRINRDVESLQYLYIIYDNDNPVFNSIVKLLRFFKSYTTDLTAFNVIYLFDSKYYNNVKLIDDIHTLTTTYDIQDSLNSLYGDSIRATHKTMDTTKDTLSLLEKFSNMITIRSKDSFGNIENDSLYDKLIAIMRKETVKNKMDFIDSLAYSLKGIQLKSDHSIIDHGIYSKSQSIHIDSPINTKDISSSSINSNITDNYNQYDLVRQIKDSLHANIQHSLTDKLFLNWDK